ncbi:MAG: alpha-L-arabinofuranosidase C-terminal domain-containing protein [bacterium]
MNRSVAKYVLMALLASFSTVYAGNPPVTELQIDLKAPAKLFAPTYAGLMTEEINHSYDGGLYAELIRNRVFRDNETNADGWSISVPTNARATMSVTRDFPLTDKLPNSLQVDISKVATNHPILISNAGYWGIPVQPDTIYKVVFWAKGNNEWSSKWNGKHEGTNPPLPLFRSPLGISLKSADGAKVYATSESPALTGEWQKIELTLKTGHDVIASKENQFVISAAAPGFFNLSLVSLFPPTYKDRPNGTRTDLMEKLADLHPQFLRFPGGNYLEGDNLWERFDWKQMRGPLEFRPGHQCCWHYRSSDGFGLLEFMGWCEDLGMEPVLAVFAGYSMHQQPVCAGPLLDSYVQDALDEIEYLTGDAKSSHWGALRAKDGHPEPFKLKYIEIGNEDMFDKSKSYDGRFAQFYDAIKAKYPELQLIATIPVKSRKPDVVDDHFYRKPDAFVKDFHHYDHVDRNGPKIFVGEWATTGLDPWSKQSKSSTTPNFSQALGDAAWMCAMERNADLIVMQCYAPLLVNVNPDASQWKPNLIGYDALSSFVSPAWHAQALFNTHRGDSVAAANLTGESSAPDQQLCYSVTRDTAKGLIYIKLVNVQKVPREVKINLGEGVGIEPEAETIILHADNPDQLNSIEKPNAVVPVKGTIHNASSDFSVNVPANALMLLTLRLK